MGVDFEQFWYWVYLHAESGSLTVSGPRSRERWLDPSF